ncbi:unnamed protein product [Rotaria socialis]|uniref:Uncharacterized protein n=1 Tax=Rotaria socialis TaxID=392032 RepID=A0A821ZLK9_9BILA|nr:unnamed protein product [Rotaria socialis]
MKTYSANMFVSLLTIDQKQTDNYENFSQSSHVTTELDPEQSTTTVVVDKPSNSNRKITLNEDDTRETWTNNFDYLITTLGGLIGLEDSHFFIVRNFNC